MKGLMFCFVALISIAIPQRYAESAEPLVTAQEHADALQSLIDVIELAKQEAANGDSSLLGEVRKNLAANAAMHNHGLAVKPKLTKPQKPKALASALEKHYTCHECGWKPSDDGPMNRKWTFEPLVAATRSASHAYDCPGGSCFAVTDDYDGTPPHLLASHKDSKQLTCNADGSGCATSQSTRCGTPLGGGRCGILQGRVRSLLKRLVCR